MRPLYCGFGANSEARLNPGGTGNLIVQLGVVTEDLNRRWFEADLRAGGQGC